MGFFGSRKEIEDLQSEIEKLKSALAKQDAKADEQRKKVDKLTEQAESARKETDELKVRNRELKDQARKGVRQDRDLQDRDQEFLRRMEAKDAALRQVQEEYVAFRQKQASSAEELKNLAEKNRKLESDLAAARKTIEIKDAERQADRQRERDRNREVPKEDKPAPDRPDRTELDALKKKVTELRMALQVSDAEVRVLKRKAEHNRRAYMVTQMQLDLAHDELYFLKTGKVRRETALARERVPRSPAAEGAAGNAASEASEAAESDADASGEEAPEEAEALDTDVQAGDEGQDDLAVETEEKQS